MHGCVDQYDVRPPGAETVSGPLAAMRGAIVDDQEHPVGRTIWLLAHGLRDQPPERQKSRSCIRSVRTTSPDERPRPPDRPERPRACIRARHGSDGQAPVAAKDACGAGPECWSSRRRTERSRAPPAPCPSSDGHRDRGSVRPCARTADRAGISNCDGATGAAHPDRANARAWCH